jgi:heme exporter protein C
VRKLFTPLAIVTALMLAYSPVLIAGAPYESTMGLVQKIFYYHVPSWMVMFTSVFICGGASVIYLFRSDPRADRVAVAAAELAAVFGLIGLVTGPLWARKAWGVWWQWDARLTTALLLWMIVLGYLLVRRYGGPGSDKLSAVIGVFGMANVPFVYISVNIWRTVHPTTNVVPTLGPGMRGTFWFCVLAFLMLYSLMLSARVRLELERARLDELHLAEEESR